MTNSASGLFTGGLDQRLPDALRIACAFANTLNGRSARNVYDGLQRAFTHVIAIGVCRRLPPAVHKNAELSKLLELVAMGYKHSRFEDLMPRKQGGGQSAGAGAPYIGVSQQSASHEGGDGGEGAHAPKTAPMAPARAQLNAAGQLSDVWERDVVTLLSMPLVATPLLELQVCA